MIKYYTKACNFYFGSISKKKVESKFSLPLHGNNLVSFDTIEILSRKKIKRIKRMKKRGREIESVKERVYLWEDRKRVKEKIYKIEMRLMN